MFVYFIRAKFGSKYIKIGKANNVERRIMELQIGNPVPLTLIDKVRCKSEFHAKQVEKLAHNIFYKQRRHGEWFNLSAKHEKQLQSLIERAAQAYMIGDQLDEELDQRLAREL